MSVGLVIVSHSAKIAEGVRDVAAQMAKDVAIVPAGGNEGGIGTNFDAVSEALGAADSGEGVVVLCDLGSAYLTAETAVDFLDDDAKSKVRIVHAPLVEGAVQAAVAAATGGDLDAVAHAAVAAGEEFVAGASGASDDPAVHDAPAAGLVPEPAPEAPGEVSATVTLTNHAGLHARPAGQVATLAAKYPNTHLTVNGVDARSLLKLMGLGLPQGAAVQIRASGDDAQTALDALVALVEDGFGENA